eukprot:3340751-Prymnesium_polylepis.2
MRFEVGAQTESSHGIRRISRSPLGAHSVLARCGAQRMARSTGAQCGNTEVLVCRHEPSAGGPRMVGV